MIDFIFGIIFCWIILGLLSGVAEYFFDGLKGPFGIVLELPFYIVGFIPIILWEFYKTMFKFVKEPIEKDRFQKYDLKRIKIAKRLYFCIDENPRWIFEKVFFVKIKENEK